MDASFASVFTDLISVVRDNIVLVVAYGLLTLVAAVALAIIVKEVVGMIMQGDKVRRTEKLTNAGIVLGLCLVAAFLPMIIVGVAQLAGTGVDLGQGSLTTTSGA